jgi:bifunctional ADP-heptose synthase (sugar kinase/adenylyltransferase)
MTLQESWDLFNYYVSAFPGRRAFALGDVILDGYLPDDCGRLSSEATWQS